MDWLAWHQEYAEPNSALSRRRRVVQRYLAATLAERAAVPGGDPIRLLSMCAGDGGDVLEVLAETGGTPPVAALLVELDPELAGLARTQAARHGLSSVRVITGDAGRTACYAELTPADIVLACGVFGNIDQADVRRTVGALPALLCPGGRVIWTRGRGDGDADASQPIRQLFAERGFTELDFTVPADAGFRVGLHRLDRPAAEPAELPEQLFRFLK
ncbi:MAG: SAM-dependent methyltransferase [Jatrophihabitantaceae bacterium]